MKHLLIFLFLLLSFTVFAQESDVVPATKGVVYGQLTNPGGEQVFIRDLEQKLVNGSFEGQVIGKVKEVCQSMGCWIKLERPDGSTLMVKTKDHAFFMPKDLVGKTVLVAGTASLEDVSEKKRKHLAEDAGKSKKEIAKIKGSVKELQYTASGVKVLD